MLKNENKTIIKETVEYWYDLINDNQFNVDYPKAFSHCWRCGGEYLVDIYPIILPQLDGKIEPSNLVILCQQCQFAAPHLKNRQILIDWLKGYKVNFPKTFWTQLGLKEYQQIYGTNFQEDLLKVGIDDHNFDLIEIEINQIMNQLLKATLEFEYGKTLMNQSTLAGIYRLAICNYAHNHGQRFPL